MSDKDYELPDDDFEEFNLEEFDISGHQKDAVDDRRAITTVKNHAIQGLKELSDDRAFQERVVKDALPAGYKQGVEATQELYGQASSMYDRAVRDAKPQMKAFKKASNRLIKSSKSMMPEGVYNRLINATETSEDAGAVNPDEAALQSGVGSLTAAMSEIEQARQQKEETTRAIDSKMAGDRHKESVTISNRLVQLTDTQVTFQNKVTATYYQKNLELQYRQWFAQRDLLELQKRSSVDILNNLTAIAKNSGLPDAIKMRNSEIWKQQTQEALVGKMNDTAQEWSTGFRNNLTQNVKTKFEEAKVEFLSGLEQVTGMVDMVADAQTMKEEMGEKTSLLGTASSIGAKYAAGWLTKRITKYAKGRLEEHDDAMAYSYQIQDMLSQAPQYITEMLKSGYPDNDIFQSFKKMVDGVIPMPEMQNTAINHNLQDKALEVVPWDLIQRRTLVEIIPEYLSLQLHEMRVMNGLDPSAGRTVYSVAREAMVSSDVRAQDTLRQVVPQDTYDKIRETLKTSIETLDSEEELEPNLRKSLERQLVFLARSNVPMTLENLSDYESYTATIPQQDIDALVSFFSAKRTEKNGRMSRDAASYQLKFGSVMSNLRTDLPNVAEAIGQHSAIANKQTLRDVGLVTQGEDGIDIVDDEKIIDGIWNDNFDYGEAFSNHNPSNGGGGGGGPRRPSSPNGSNDGGSRIIDYTKPITRISVNSELIKDILDKGITVSSPTIEEPTGDLGVIEQRLAAQTDLLTSIDGTLRDGIKVNGGVISVFGSEESSISSMVAGGIKGTGNFISNYYRNVYNAAKGVGNFVKQKAVMPAFNSLTKLRESDVYLEGSKRIAISLARLKSGELIDELTGNVITSVEDITGPVIDEYGDYVITAEEFARGLWTKDGETLLSRGMSWVTTKPAEFLGNYYKTVFGAATTTVKAVGNFINTEIINRPKDIYVDGDDPWQPRMTAALMSRGFYFNASGTPITTIDDIDGAVFDKHSNQLIAEEELSKLVDVDGDTITTRTIGQIVANIARFGVNMAFKAGKRALGMVKGVYEGIFGIGDVTKGLFEGLRGFFTSQVKNMTIDADNVTLNVMGKMDEEDKTEMFTKQFGKMNESLDDIKEATETTAENSADEDVFGDNNGDGMRDGSFKSIFAKRQAAKDAAAARKADLNAKADKQNANKDDEKGILSKILGGGLKSLLLGGLSLGAASAFAGNGEEGNTSGGSKVGMGHLAAGAGAVMLAPTAAKAGAKGLWKLGTKGLPWLARGAMAIPSILGAAAASPLAIPLGIAAAVGAAGYGGYKAFKFMARRSNVELLESLRFAHYGVREDESDKIVKLRYLEDELYDKVYFERGLARVKMTMGEFIEEFAGDFDVDKSNNEQVHNLLNWIRYRFIPVYLKHRTVIKNIDSSVDLLDVDDELEDGLKPDYARRSRVSTGEPYTVYTSPFPNETIETGTDRIDAIEAEISKKFGQAAQQYKHKTVKSAPTVGAAAIPQATAMKGVVAETGYGYRPTIAKAKTTEPKLSGVKLEELRGDLARVNGSLGEIEALRFKAYGSVDLLKDKVAVLAAMEAELIPHVSYPLIWGDTELDYSAADAWNNFGSLCGLNLSSGEDKANWETWFRERFVPLFIHFNNVRRKIDKKILLTSIDKEYTNKQKERFLTNFIPKDNSPFECSASPWGGKLATGLRVVGNALKNTLTLFKNAKETYNDPTLKAKSGTDGLSVLFKENAGTNTFTPTNRTPLRSTTNNRVNNTPYRTLKDMDVEYGPLTDDVEKNIKRFDKFINEAAKTYNVDPDLIRSIIRQESGGDANAVSPVGAKGLMQLMNGTAGDMGVKDSFDPRDNIMGGTKYIARQLRNNKGNIPLALASYNGGYGYVMQAKRDLGTDDADIVLRALAVTKFKGKRPDHKQMQDYAYKIVKDYARRTGKKPAEIMKGDSRDIVKLTKATTSSSPNVAIKLPEPTKVTQVEQRQVSSSSETSQRPTRLMQRALVKRKAAQERIAELANKQAIDTKRKTQQISQTVIEKQLSSLISIDQKLGTIVNHLTSSNKPVTSPAPDPMKMAKAPRANTGVSYDTMPATVDMGNTYS